jgi:hypothetical protein
MKKLRIFAPSKNESTFFDMMEKYIREQINRGLSD